MSVQTPAKAPDFAQDGLSAHGLTQDAIRVDQGARWLTAHAKGLMAEAWVLGYLRSIGLRVARVPIEEQRRGAGDLWAWGALREQMEIEVKGNSDRNGCPIELASHGSVLCKGGVDRSLATHVAFVRLVDGVMWLVTKGQVLEALGGWIERYGQVPYRDGPYSRTSRTAVPVPWAELDRLVPMVRVGPPIVQAAPLC